MLNQTMLVLIFYSLEVLYESNSVSGSDVGSVVLGESSLTEESLGVL